MNLRAMVVLILVTGCTAMGHNRRLLAVSSCQHVEEALAQVKAIQEELPKPTEPQEGEAAPPPGYPAATVARLQQAAGHLEVALASFLLPIQKDLGPIPVKERLELGSDAEISTGAEYNSQAGEKAWRRGLIPRFFRGFGKGAVAVMEGIGKVADPLLDRAERGVKVVTKTTWSLVGVLAVLLVLSAVGSWLWQRHKKQLLILKEDEHRQALDESRRLRNQKEEERQQALGESQRFRTIATEARDSMERLQLMGVPSKIVAAATVGCRDLHVHHRELRQAEKAAEKAGIGDIGAVVGDTMVEAIRRWKDQGTIPPPKPIANGLMPDDSQAIEVQNHVDPPPPVENLLPLSEPTNIRSAADVDVNPDADTKPDDETDPTQLHQEGTPS